jgi:hypothetical protein
MLASTVQGTRINDQQKTGIWLLLKSLQRDSTELEVNPLSRHDL